MQWQAILADMQQNWILYASMPLVAAAIGYGTKVVAIRMMFEPIEFVGLKAPYLGWQGIVPRKSATMAEIACDTMTTHLIKPADVFGKLDPDRVAEEIEKPLLAALEQITREVASQFQPGLWESIPEAMRGLIIRRVQAEAPEMVRGLMREIQGDIEGVFDLKAMVINALMRDKRLLNRIFQDAGVAEFRFIRNSGIWFGFAIGCVQAFTWAATHSPWIMPLFGGFTGWFTDWLALKMIFNPKKPTRYLFGLVEWQGLFLKHRKEVAARYGALVADEILTPANIIEAVLRGPLSDRLFAMVQRHVQRAVDEQAGVAKPLVVFAVGGRRYQEIKQAVAEKIMQRLPEALKAVESYAQNAMDLRNTLVNKMQQLDEERFERLLRPAFQQDEWILITVGAVLGFLVGEMQVQIMLHLGGVH